MLKLSGRQHKIISLMEDLKGIKVLDIGCSYGWFENYALKDKPKEICAIEPKASLFAETKKKYPTVKYYVASVLELPFEDNYFDAVVMFDVIEHIPKNTENVALREIARVLKPGGTFYLTTPKKSIAGNLLDPAWLLGHRHYKASEMQDLLDAAGFKLDWVKFGGRYVSILYMILFYFFKFVLRREMNIFSKWFERKRIEEYESDSGFVTVFIKARLKK